MLRGWPHNGCHLDVQATSNRGHAPHITHAPCPPPTHEQDRDSGTGGQSAAHGEDGAGSTAVTAEQGQLRRN